MFNFIKKTALFLLIGLSISSMSPSNQDDYFVLPIAHNHLISVIFDPTKNPYSQKMVERLIGDLEKAGFTKTKNIQYASVDINKIEMMKSHYTIETPYVLFYYIRNKLQKFTQFSELATNFLDQKMLYTDFLEKVSTFITSKIERICSPISSMAEYHDALQKHKIIAIFLGKSEGFFFNQYLEFAERNIDFNFYYAKDNFVSDVVYFENLNLPRPQNQIFFGIARHESLLNDFDTKKLVLVDPKKTMPELSLFFEFEKYPKMRDSESGDDSFYRMFNHNEKLILYVKNKESTEEEIKEFRRAVFLMPKLFIFTEISTEDPKWGSFMQIFIHGRENPVENRVYVIAAPFGHLIIRMIPSQIMAEKIMEGVQRFYQQNKGAFSEVERQIFSGPENAPQSSETQDELSEINETKEEYIYQEL